MLRFLVFGVGGTYADLAEVGVFECVGGGVVVNLSVLMDNVFSPGSFFMVGALCCVGENWMLQSWWRHGLDADGG